MRLADIPTVSFCKLAETPEIYVNKLVRIEANYIVWWESSYLYGDSCSNDEHKIHNAIDCASEDEKCTKTFAKEWDKLTPYMRDSGRRYKTLTAYRVKAVFTGRLIGPGGFGHLNSFRYALRIRSVDKASSIPKNAPW